MEGRGVCISLVGKQPRKDYSVYARYIFSCIKVSDILQVALLSWNRILDTMKILGKRLDLVLRLCPNLGKHIWSVYWDQIPNRCFHNNEYGSIKNAFTHNHCRLRIFYFFYYHIYYIMYMVWCIIFAFEILYRLNICASSCQCSDCQGIISTCRRSLFFSIVLMYKNGYI